MRILAFSDTHGLLPELVLSGIDRVLIAGDVCPATNHSPAFQRLWLEQRFYPWVEALRIPVYLALGNHDFVDDFTAPQNLRYGTHAVVDDVLLFSWTPKFYQWAWMADEDVIARRLDDIMGEDTPPIWVTHSPPYGVCDEVRKAHQGSKALRKAIEWRCPRLVVCGHLHEGAPEGRIGETDIRNVSFMPDGKVHLAYLRGNTRVFNVSMLNDEYQVFRKPVVIDL